MPIPIHAFIGCLWYCILVIAIDHAEKHGLDTSYAVVIFLCVAMAVTQMKILINEIIGE